MKLLIILYVGWISISSCIAGESECRVFLDAKKPYELPLVKEELLGLSIYPLNFVAEIEKIPAVFRITKSGGWGKTVSYTLTLTDKGDAIYSKKLIIVEQKNLAVLMKSSLMNKEELNIAKKMISDIEQSVKKHAESPDAPTSKELEMDTPFVLIEYFSAEGYKGSLILPAGYHLLSEDTEKLLSELAGFTDQAKEK